MLPRRQKGARGPARFRPRRLRTFARQSHLRSQGTGKSHTLKEAIKALRSRRKGKVFVTASTGAAATQVGGTTIHMFAGIGLGQEPAADLARKVASNRHASKRWRECGALVIDEISMVEAALFDKLDHVARYVRGSDDAFGGIQLLVCGDFLQLPPVSKGGGPDADFFAFEASAWRRCFPEQRVLTKVFRQRDATFVDILNELRVGKLSNRSAALLRKLKHTDLSPWTREGVEPTRLNCYNADVDRINDAALARLHAGGDGLRTFDAQDSGAEPYLGSLRKNGAFPERLQLKVGAQVMLLVNLDVEAGLVNGSRGVVTGFASEQGKKDASLRTEDVTGVVVKFTTGRTQTIARDVKAIEEGNVQKAKRAQFPLRLAWAISIHKSQGQTLDLLEVDLRGCFEYGQAYTAVSRATSMDRLRVLNFDLAGVKAHARVVRFHDDLVARNPAVLHDAALKSAAPVFAEEAAGGWIKKRPAGPAPPARPAPPPPKRARYTPLAGKSVAFAGELPRAALASAVAAAGGTVDGSVRSMTRYLVAGDVMADGDVVERDVNFQAARRMDVPVLTADKFRALLDPPAR